MHKSRARTLATVLLVALLNLLLTARLFTVAYTHHMGSIEAAYIGLARYIAAHWQHLDWFTLWYNGTPFQNTYPPLLHLLSASLVTLVHLDPGRAYHVVAAAFYVLGPAAIFLLAWRLGGDRAHAAFVAVLYSLVAPSVLLIAEVRHDSAGFMWARRLQALVQYGEGPHVGSMALMVLAVVALDAAVRKGGTVRWLLCSVALAATVLCNWIGGLSLAVCVLCYLLAIRRGWLGAVLAGGYAYLLAAPWIPPSTIRTIKVNAEFVHGPYAFTWRHWLYAALFMALLSALVWLLKRAKAPLDARFAALASYSFGYVLAAWYLAGVAVVPQPNRYHLEFDIAACLLAGALTRALVPLFDRKVRKAAVAIAVALALPAVFIQQRAAHREEHGIDIHRTIEYRTARAIEERIPRGRVFVPGTISFWLNAFAPAQQQMGGGFEQGNVNIQLPHTQFQLYFGPDPQVALNWLRIYGCDAVAVSGPKSEETYHPTAYPLKYEGVLPVLWRDDDVTLYQVPRQSRSLAHVMHTSDLAKERPAYPQYLSSIAPFLAALEDPAQPKADFAWRATNQARVTANLQRDQILYVQVSWHKGWHALVNGRQREVKSEPLGMIVVEPHCEGPCTVDLEYGGGAEMSLLRAASLLALSGGIAAAVVQSVRRRSADILKS